MTTWSVHPYLRLLNKSVNLAVVIENDYTILGGVIHLGDQNASFGAPCLVKIHEILKRVLANYVAVWQNPKQSCQWHPSSMTKSLCNAAAGV